MKTGTYSIFFDDQCPFCIWYSAKFVQWGILTEDNRKPFDLIYQAKYDAIDREKAKSQIALIDESTGEVSYGANSMIKLLALKAPFMSIFLKYRALNYIAQKVYLLISYNRKVMAPNISCTKNSCNPAFHLGYRLAFLFITALFTGFILNSYTKSIYQNIYGHQMPAVWEYCVCFGQIFFQALVVGFTDRKKTWEYLGQMSLISFLGALALVPMLLAELIIGVSHYLTIGYFGVIVAGMFLLHLKRVKIIGAPVIMSLTWILYRIIILIIMSKI